MTVNPPHQLEFQISVFYALINKIIRRCAGEESGKTWCHDACFGVSLVALSLFLHLDFPKELFVFSLHFFKFPLNLQVILFWSLSPLFDAKLLAELIMSMLVLNSVEVFILISLQIIDNLLC